MMWWIIRAAGLFLLTVVGRADAVSVDGSWQLQISGHHSFVFGESGFGGGVRIPWEVLIRFDISDGEYLLGSGSARWLGWEETVSRPGGWFDCRQVEGTYLDSNLNMHETPRVRFSGFPVAGSVEAGRVRLQPGYSAPGNYLAVTYECLTDNPGADNWFVFAERGKQVLGKRQDAETRSDADGLAARVREVAPLPPESGLDLPLLDGWTFAQGSEEGDRLVRFELRRQE